MNTITPCCQEFGKALQPCTDNEGYGRLVSWHSGQLPTMGCDLEPLRFCPWCGDKLSLGNESQGVNQNNNNATAKTSKEDASTPNRQGGAEIVQPGNEAGV